MAWKVVLIAVLLTIAPLVSADTNLLLFSDVHYDPLYGQEKGYGKCNVASSPPLGTIGCDAPAALIKSALDDMKQNAPDMPTLLAGDWQRHKYEASGLGTTAVFQPVSAWIQEMMSNTQLFAGTFGNNDFVPNYGFDYAATSHPDMAERVDAMKAATLLSDEEATQMKQCGFFSRSVNADMMVISLHTLLWTYRIQPEIPDTVADPCGQFEFFRTQVAAARAAGQTVVVLGHIPPIAKVKKIVEKGSFKSLSSDMYWKPAYQQEYASILSANKDVIVMQVYGHTHMFSLGVFDHMGGVPMVIVPAISKVSGNRPCYMIAALKPKGRLMGLRQRYMAADGTWTDGMHVGGALGFSQGFDSAEGMQQQLIDIGSHNARYTGWTNYLTLHSGGELEMATYPDSTCDSFCRALTVCAMVHDTYEPLKACVAEVRAAQGPPVDLSGSIVTTTLILVTVFGVCLTLGLMKIVPMIRSGELSFSKIIQDFKEELFNESPRKEQRPAASSREGDDLDAPESAHDEPAATHTHDVDADNDTSMRMFFDTEPSHFIEELPADERLEAERIP